MVNHDHSDNIGTHPAYSKDPETALRARLEAATRKQAEANQQYTIARHNLRVFLSWQAANPDAEPVIHCPDQTNRVIH